MASVVAGRVASDWCPDFAGMRADGYVLLAALLGSSPTSGLRRAVRGLVWGGALPGGLERALNALRRAGEDYPLAAIREEHRKLFVGLGSGEMVPYASWYKGRTLQSLPLAALRADLRELGIARQDGTHESEDHAGALCEIMALLAGDGSAVPVSRQARFFREHVVPWMGNFFTDLKAAPSAGFYRAVGAFGDSFLAADGDFLRSALAGEPRTQGG